MEVKLTGPKTLILPSPAVAYILDKLSECPYKDVRQLIADIFFQLKKQEITNEDPIDPPADSDSNGMFPAGPADR